MPLKLEIIRATEFVRVGAQGHFDLAASKAALATVAGACRKRGIQNAVLDLRALLPGPKPVFSPADLVELVNTFPEVGFTKRLHLAILYLTDPHKRARLFVFLSTLHGWNVRAFGDFEQALLWLASSQEKQPWPARRSPEHSIPVQRTEAGIRVGSSLKRPRSYASDKTRARPPRRGVESAAAPRQV